MSSLQNNIRRFLKFRFDDNIHITLCPIAEVILSVEVDTSMSLDFFDSVSYFHKYCFESVFFEDTKAAEKYPKTSQNTIYLLADDYTKTQIFDKMFSISVFVSVKAIFEENTKK